MKIIVKIFRLKLFFVILLILSLTTNSFIVYSTQDNNDIILEFFYTEGCDTCDSKKPIVHSIENKFQDNISIIWVLVHDDPSTYNYSYWRTFGFDFVPSIVIRKSSESGFVAISHDIMTEDYVENIINSFLNDEVPSNYGIKPVIVTNTSINASASEKIVFNAKDSYDPDGRIIFYTWEFETEDEVDGNMINHSFSKPGIYKVKLTIEDDSGYQDFTEIKVYIDDSNQNTNNTPYVSFILIILLFTFFIYFYRKKRLY